MCLTKNLLFLSHSVFFSTYTHASIHTQKDKLHFLNALFFNYLLLFFFFLSELVFLVLFTIYIILYLYLYYIYIIARHKLNKKENHQYRNFVNTLTISNK